MDALVKLLNKLGYQPILLPKTGVKPPDLYNKVRDHLVRRGHLSAYLPPNALPHPTKNRVADIDHKVTSDKKFEAAGNFLSAALRCIGIEKAPKLDLGFSKSKEFHFAFVGVTNEAIEPAAIDQILEHLKLDSLPRSLIDAGDVHICYEYLYANELLLQSSNGVKFENDLAARIGEYVDIGSRGTIEVKSSTTIAFKASDQRNAAFAYKCGRLTANEGKWSFYPEEVSLGTATRPYLPGRGVVLRVEDLE